MIEQDSVAIHICTKDRPELLRGLLTDIDEVVSVNKQIFVYDDSVSPANRRKNSGTLDAMPYPTVYIDEPTRQVLLADLPWPSAQAEAYGDYAFKKLGEPRWDLAGVRSFAHFVGALTTEPGSMYRRVLFLDDDIGLKDGVFQGEKVRVDSRKITSTISNPLSVNDIVACGYAGRADAYLADHLKAQQRRTSVLSDDPTVIHAKKAGNRLFKVDRAGRLAGIGSYMAKGGVPVSGAFLLMRPETVCKTAVPHCYNEDQIVIAAAQSRGSRIGVAPFRPLHKGDVTTPTIEVAQIQQIGTVLFRAVQHALSEVPSIDSPILPIRAATLCYDYAKNQRGNGVKYWRNRAITLGMLPPRTPQFC